MSLKLFLLTHFCFYDRQQIFFRWMGEQPSGHYTSKWMVKSLVWKKVFDLGRIFNLIGQYLQIMHPCTPVSEVRGSSLALSTTKNLSHTI